MLRTSLLIALLLSSSIFIVGSCSSSVNAPNSQEQPAATLPSSAPQGAAARKAAIATIRRIAQAAPTSSLPLDCAQPVVQVLQRIATIYETSDIEAAQARCHYCLAGEEATVEKIVAKIQDIHAACKALAAPPQ